MVKYSKTGKFTAKQIKLAEEIAKKIDELQRTGCAIFGKSSGLLAYKSADLRHSSENGEKPYDTKYPIKCLECGRIVDSGADDEEYFEKGYITEE